MTLDPFERNEDHEALVTSVPRIAGTRNRLPILSYGDFTRMSEIVFESFDSVTAKKDLHSDEKAAIEEYEAKEHAERFYAYWYKRTSGTELPGTSGLTIDMETTESATPVLPKLEHAKPLWVTKDDAVSHSRALQEYAEERANALLKVTNPRQALLINAGYRRAWMELLGILRSGIHVSK